MPSSLRYQYTADFETTTDPNDCRVWAWAICDIHDVNTKYYGNDIASFINKIRSLCNCEIYFHNLRFDSQFIIYYLLKIGFKHTTKDKAKSLTFNTVINGENQIYALEIIFDKVKGKSRNYYKKVKIFDSLKKLPFTVKKIANDFDLPIKKGELDYNAYREKGHQLTSEEKSYLDNDVEIMARALNIQFAQGLKRMTIGSDALNSYKQIIGKMEFKNRFPILSEEQDNYIRRAYHGGWTYVNPKFQCKDIGKGKVYDVNSLYPWAMRYNKYPVGKPNYFIGKYVPDDAKCLHVQRFNCTFKLKKGYLPCVQVRNNRIYKETEYLVESVEPTILTMCDVDMALFFEHYDVDVTAWIDGYSFYAKEGVFDEYIDSWYKVKETSKGAVKQLAKLMLNNLYGKFATSPQIVEKKPIIEDDVVKYVVDEITTKDAIYIPVGVWCTAYARNKTIRTAQKVFDRFIYADTDSIHLEGDYEPIELKGEIDDKKLGLWKNESNFERGRFLKAKTYVEEELSTKEEVDSHPNTSRYYEREGTYYHLNVKCAGMNDAIKDKVTFDNFRVGFSSFGKLIPKNVEGGVVLEDTEFTIKEFELNKIVI